MRGSFDHVKLIERKVLAQHGQGTAARAASRSPRAPWKKWRSVSTLRAAAPPLAYISAIDTGSNSSARTPLLGDAFLISPMIAGERALSAPGNPDSLCSRHDEHPRGVPARRDEANRAQARRAYVRQCGLRYRGLHAPFEVTARGNPHGNIRRPAPRTAAQRLAPSPNLRHSTDIELDCSTLPDACELRLNFRIARREDHAQIVCDRLDIRKRLTQIMDKRTEPPQVPYPRLLFCGKRTHGKILVEPNVDFNTPWRAASQGGFRRWRFLRCEAHR